MTRIIEDINSPDRPPRDETPPRARATADDPPESGATVKQAPLTPDEKKLAQSIEQAYGMIGAGIAGIGLRLQDHGLQGTGIETCNMAESLSLAWIELARKNPRVKQYLKKIVEASAAGVLVGMHVAVLLPLLVDRGIIPLQMAGMAAAAGSTNGDGTFA